MTKNLSRIVYLPKFNQRDMIETRLVKGDKIPNAERISSGLSKMVSAVIDREDPDSLVALGAFFSNIDGNRKYYKEKWGLTLIVFPLQGQRIDYSIEPKDFFVNVGRDPIEISSIGREESYWAADNVLLFRESFFENRKKYRLALRRIVSGPTALRTLLKGVGY